MQTELFGSTACVSIYQSPQSAYDLFDKAIVLYEGRQIFFGRTDHAKQYFVNLGYHCPERATTPDFLTSMTSPKERIVREGFEARVPRTPDEFALAWKNSAEYKALQADIEDYKSTHPLNGADAEAFRASKKAQQARGQRAKSPFTLSFTQQIRLCLWRGWRRLIGDPSLTLGALIGNFVMALIISSVFYNLQMTTSSFFQRGALLFFACLMNAFASALEVSCARPPLVMSVPGARANHVARNRSSPYTRSGLLSRSMTAMPCTIPLPRRWPPCCATCRTRCSTQSSSI